VKLRILTAAQAEFMAHGYEGASTNRITARFGGSKATVFRHYPTKEALLGAVVKAIAGQWEQALRADDLPSTTPTAWLEAVGLRTLAWILGEEPLFIGRLAIAEGHKFPSLQHIFAETAGLPLRAFIARQLRRWTDEGVLQCADPKADADSYLDLVVTGLVSRRLYGEPLPSVARRKTHVQRNVRLFLRGCLPRGCA
jgi:TetR/AcrR family transcriptional regulator, mexJK operon transcriptional repressor